MEEPDMRSQKLDNQVRKVPSEGEEDERRTRGGTGIRRRGTRRRREDWYGGW